MFGIGGKLSLAAVDAGINAAMEKVLDAAGEFAGELPLVGINVNIMHDIEAKGIALCKSRLTEIETEIARLQVEARNTAAIIEAGLAKLEKLKGFISPVAPDKAGDDPTTGPVPVEVPAAVHTDIRTDRPKAEPVITDIQA